MSNLIIRRKLSIINDRSPLFVYIDNNNQGKIVVLKDMTINLSEGNHIVYIKD